MTVVGVVDDGDYNFWKNAFGMSVTPGTSADGNGDGIVDEGDYVVWLARLGETSAGVVSASNVPEPSTLLLIGCLGIFVPVRHFAS